MHRIYILIVLMFSCSLLLAQGAGEFIMLDQDFNEERYRLFLKAARHDGDSTKVVMLTAMYGKYLVHQQRYPEAEQALYESLDIIKKMPGELHYAMKFYSHALYDGYDYLGEYYTQTGDYKKAEYFLQQSEQLRAQHFSRGSPHCIFNLQNLAEFYLNTDQTSKSEVYLIKLNKELNHTRFNNEKLKSAYGTYYRGMTEVCIRQGRLSESKVFLKKYAKFLLGPFSSYKGAMHYFNYNPQITLFQSRILLMEGNPQGALEQADHGVAVHPDSLDALPQLLQIKSICLHQLGKNSEALSAAKTLLEIHLHNINKVFYSLSEGEKETMFNRTRDAFDLFNSLFISSLDDSQVAPEYLTSLIDFRLQTKALLLNNSIKIRKAIYASRDSALINDYRRLSQLKNKVSREVFRKSSKKEMGVYEEEIKDLEKSVSRRVELKNMKDAHATSQDIRQKVGVQEAAVEIIRVRKLGVQSRIKETHKVMYGLTDTIMYFSVILTRDRLDYALIENGNDLEDRYFKRFKNQVLIAQADTTLYAAFWNPIDKKTRNFNTLYLSGDGVYNRINVNLLQNKKGYLEDQKEIILLSNLKDILEDEAPETAHTAAFFGQPNFDLSHPSSEADARRDIPNFQMEALKETDFKDLPGTKTEVVNGSQVLAKAGWKIESFLGDDASEGKLKSLNDPSLLHIATHGFFVEGSGLNPMLRSGLIFSGVKSADEIQGEDGVLTAYEASNLNLDHTRLVILSACETGSGEVKTGEGVYGLQRAFLIAGAHNIIMSLWKVDDLATQKLMTLFYSNLVTEKNVRTAFTNAQQTLRKEYAEPFYWGGFILIGK